MEVVDQVCKNFEDYAQAKEKRSGKPTIIRQVFKLKNEIGS